MTLVLGVDLGASDETFFDLRAYLENPYESGGILPLNFAKWCYTPEINSKLEALNATVQFRIREAIQAGSREIGHELEIVRVEVSKLDALPESAKKYKHVNYTHLMEITAK